jgi:hypothetical protein
MRQARSAMSTPTTSNATPGRRTLTALLGIAAALVLTTAGRTDAGTADACALVTAREVAALIPGAQPTPSASSANGAATAVCGWASPGSTLPTLEVRVSPDSPALKTGLGANRDYLRMVFQKEAEENSGRYVADLGDVAKVESLIAMSAEATVVIGTTMLVVEYTGQGAAARQDQVLAFARLAVKRLGGGR